MNMQAMMKQAQALQKEMLKDKKEIDDTEFTGESSLVKVTVKGTKEVVKVEINKDSSLSADDLEMLEDMILIAVNEANKKVDEVTEKKMSKFGNIPGLF
jgi:DNA-binding YbaB/EbfC family protein